MQSNIVNNCLSSILRNTIRFYARKTSGKNPGLQKRLDLFDEKQEKNDLNDVDFEDLETDFMDAGNMHKIHEQELKQFQEKEKYWIVRRKYFKEKQINFLTWNDKEQIRYLNNKNPDEWTIEKLSEGFPALPETIQKVLKAKWQPETENRIKNHDKRVENNWKLLKDKKLELSPQIIEHVSKFSKRKPKVEFIDQKIIIESSKTNRSGEYGSIIENYNKLVSKKEPTENKTETRLEINELDSTSKESLEYLGTSKKDRGLTTLSELRKGIARKLDLGKKVDEHDKMILKETKNINEKEVTLKDNIGISLTTYKVEANKVAVNEDNKILKSLQYPENIIIPKEKYKKGYTYKVNDCYYDDDGEFLYRVPGIY